jgi:hypothetical protein
LYQFSEHPPAVRPRGDWPQAGHQEETMSGSVIVAGARTPIGRLLGGLKSFSGADLGGFAIKAALERAGVSPSRSST